jgi:hypothetical protein
MTRTRNPKQRQLTQRAQALLTRIEKMNCYGDFEFEKSRQRELANIELMIDLLSGPHLSAQGRQFVEWRLGWSEDWCDNAD